MNLIFIDTEFTDFLNIELMSLGMVTERGEELYVEITDYNRGKESEFVRNGIVQMFDHAKYGKTKHDAALYVKEWLEALPGNSVLFVADYYSDFQLLQDLLADVEVNKKLQAGMIDKALMMTLHERGFHLPGELSKAYRRFVMGVDGHEDHHFRRHHALDDAKMNRYAFLEALKAAKE